MQRRPAAELGSKRERLGRSKSKNVRVDANREGLVEMAIVENVPVGSVDTGCQGGVPHFEEGGEQGGDRSAKGH